MKRFSQQWFMEIAMAIGTIIAFAFIGVLLAWRG